MRTGSQARSHWKGPERRSAGQACKSWKGLFHLFEEYVEYGIVDEKDYDRVMVLGEDNKGAADAADGRKANKRSGNLRHLERDEKYMAALAAERQIRV